MLKALPDFLRILNYFTHRSACYEGSSLKDVSVDLDHLYENLGSKDKIALGGYNAIINAIVSIIEGRKGTEIRLGHVVQKVEYNNDNNNDINNNNGVKVYVDGIKEPFKADYCVCTVPLGVLQHRDIQFIPDLSEYRYKAIDNIGMGLLNKVILQFDTNFWNHQKVFAITNKDSSKVKSFYDCTSDIIIQSKNKTSSDTHILMLFLGGDAAQRIESMMDEKDDDDEIIISEIMESLRKVYGKDDDDNTNRVPCKPKAYKITRWLHDKFAYGSYSYTKVGMKEEYFDEVATPIDEKLFFAGEHTSKTMHSTVHGAWATGKREAQRLISKLSAKK